MSDFETENLFGRVAAHEFAGREPELEKICMLAGRNPRTRSAVLLGAPRSGKSELLRQSFDRLFFQAGESAPFYYCLRSDCLTPLLLARDYFAHFLAQFTAFRRTDARLIETTGEPLSSIALQAATADLSWCKSLVERLSQAIGDGDERSALAIAASAPAIAASNSGSSILAMIDNFHLLDDATQATRAEMVRAVCGASGAQAQQVSRAVHLQSGLRRVLLEMMPPDEQFFSGLEAIKIEPASDGMLEKMIRAHARSLGVAISDSTVELMIQQLGRDLVYIRALVRAAASRESGLKTFMEFERVYTEEVLDGGIGCYLDALLREAAPEMRSRQAAIEALGLMVESEAEVPIQVVVQRTGLPQAAAENLLSRLHARELLEVSFGFVKREDDPVLWDYVRARYRDWIAGSPRPLAGSELLGEKLKHSYRLMMSRYSRAVEAQLVELLSKFDFQSVPSVLFNQILFDKDYEGLGRIQTVRLLEDEQERVRLPQITMVSDLGSAETAGCYCRMFHASGFEGGVYSAANEVIWLIALIVSKEPADLSAIDAITQRLDMAFRGRTRHAISGLQERNVNTRAGASLKAIRWYISKEGFSKSAGDRISAAAGYHSTFTQLDLAHDHILSVVSESRSTEGTAFELVIPIEDDAELIAARTVEQIARTGDFDQESINQIKTALIEACLNAAEHSDSPDRKIYQKFILANDRLVITVSSKGKQFSASATEGALAGSPKRGRGLQIIKALMDEVRFEQTDDGSSLVMAKLLKRPESQL